MELGRRWSHLWEEFLSVWHRCSPPIMEMVVCDFPSRSYAKTCQSAMTQPVWNSFASKKLCMKFESSENSIKLFAIQVQTLVPGRLCSIHHGHQAILHVT